MKMITNKNIDTVIKVVSKFDSSTSLEDKRLVVAFYDVFVDSIWKHLKGVPGLNLKLEFINWLKGLKTNNKMYV